MAKTKRKLPVLNTPGDGAAGAESEERPPWQWVGFGAAMIVVAWLPLAYLGLALVGLGTASVARGLAASALPLVLATLGGGFLVGRYGKPAGVREALLAGLVVGLVAVGLTALSGPLSPLSLVVVAIATGGAGAGGALGARRRGA